jgi:hypothetical protein
MQRDWNPWSVTDGLFGMFLKRVKTTFVPRRPRSRNSNSYDFFCKIKFHFINKEICEQKNVVERFNYWRSS